MRVVVTCWNECRSFQFLTRLTRVPPRDIGQPQDRHEQHLHHVCGHARHQSRLPIKTLKNKDFI